MIFFHEYVKEPRPGSHSTWNAFRVDAAVDTEHSVFQNAMLKKDLLNCRLNIISHHADTM